MEPGVIIILAVLVGAAVIAIVLYSAAQRRKELAAYATKRGLSFRPDKDRDMDDRYAGFRCLRRGHSRFAHNVMSGELEGMQITAFDYHYATGSGKHRRTHRFSAVITRSPIPLKPLFLRRERAFDKLTEFLGMDDIDFESAEFSRTFFVKAADKRWAFDVIHQGMMDHLLAGPRLSFEFDESNIITWSSRRFDGREFDEAAGFVRDTLDLMPEYLSRTGGWRDSP